jgi:hypothetical protein
MVWCGMWTRARGCSVRAAVFIVGGGRAGGLRCGLHGRLRPMELEPEPGHARPRPRPRTQPGHGQSQSHCQSQAQTRDVLCMVPVGPVVQWSSSPVLMGVGVVLQEEWGRAWLQSAHQSSGSWPSSAALLAPTCAAFCLLRCSPTPSQLESFPPCAHG